MPFKCAVIVREVWDTRDLVSDVLLDGKIKDGALATRLEPEDLNALEMALQVKDRNGGTVVAFAIGASRGVEVLRECLYRGVDEVVQVGVPTPGQALDTGTEAELYAAALRKAGPFDLVLAGVTVPDGSSSILAAHVAALLDAEQITWVDALEEIAPGRVVARRAIEMGTESIEAKMPAVLAVGVALLREDPRSPRSAKATLKLKHKKTALPVWTAESLGVSLGSPGTRIASLSPIAQRTIESRFVDPADDAALRAMLGEILGGLR